MIDDIGTKNTKISSWSKEIEQEVQRKKTLYLKWLNTKNPEDRHAWLQQKRLVTRMSRERNNKV